MTDLESKLRKLAYGGDVGQDFTAACRTLDMLRTAADLALDAAHTAVLEASCERGTPWDLACCEIAKRISSLRTSARNEPTYCSVHQHYKWCKHNGGVMGSSGYEAPILKDR